MKKLLSLIMAMVMLLALMVGCSAKTTEETVEPEAETAQIETAEEEHSGASAETPVPTPQEEPEESVQEEEVVVTAYDMPLAEENVEFTLWCEGAPGFMSSYLGEEGNFNSAEATKYVRQLTGVTIEYQCIDASAFTEQFNLMIASGEYPDLIQGLPARYSGGAEQAFQDEVIIDLREYIDTQMPVYKGLITDMELEQDLINDDGNELGFASITTGSVELRGPTVRSDWLEELGIDMPETYDELYEMALALNSAKDLDGVFFFNSKISPDGTFTTGLDLPAFDLTSSGSHLYQKNDEMMSAYTQPEFKEFLAMVSKWYAEGLINSDFYSYAASESNNVFLGGKYAVVWDNANYITQNCKKYEDFESAGLPITRREKGQTLHTYGDRSSAEINLCVSTACENVDILCKYIDWLYTEEGQLFCNYGMEGKSYYLDDQGSPQWLEEMYTNDNIPFQMMSVTYILPSMPSVYDDSRQLSVTLDDRGMTALELWNDDSNTDGLYALTVNMTYTEDETSVYNAHIGDIESYVSTFVLKVITGETDLDAEWDAYVAQLEVLGLSDVLEVVQSAYDRAMEKKYR